MRAKYGIGIIAVLVAAAAAGGALPAEKAAEVEREVRETLAAEQQALVERGCEGALAFFRDRSPLFVSNGRTRANKGALLSVCTANPPAPTGPREPRGHEVQVLSPTSAYSVSTYRRADAAVQIVTKIWEKGPDGWRIVHAHESETR